MQKDAREKPGGRIVARPAEVSPRLLHGSRKRRQDPVVAALLGRPDVDALDLAVVPVPEMRSYELREV